MRTKARRDRMGEEQSAIHPHLFSRDAFCVEVWPKDRLRDLFQSFLARFSHQRDRRQSPDASASGPHASLHKPRADPVNEGHRLDRCSCFEKQD